jgi:hypothetical protein
MRDEPNEPTETTPASSSSIEHLMREVPPDGARDLDAEALAAAEAALQQGQAAAAQAAAALAEASPRPWLTPARRRTVLRAVLGLNLLLMVGMLLLPSPTAPAAAPAPADGATGQPAQLPAPELRDPRDLAVSVPDRELYDRAVLASLEGRHEDAVALLEHYLRRHPDMPPPLRATVYGQLAHYSVLLNRRDDALRYGTMAGQLRQRTALPDELIASARRAEAEGRGADARRDWARLLLQQGMLRPDQRLLLAEAYLRLGDSYRIDADHGAGQERGR